MRFEAELDGPLVVIDQREDAPRVKSGDREYVRDAAGTWCYADTGVPVPGATDRTLSKLVTPASIVSDDQVEQMVIGADEVNVYRDELSWCIEIGLALTDPRSGETKAYVVPVDEWRARADQLLGISAPELSENEDERALAEIERQVRLASSWQKRAVTERARVLRDVSARGMTRRKAAQITGLSAARIQQLVDEQLPEPGTEHLELLQRLVKAGSPMSYRKLGGSDEIRPLMQVLSKSGFVSNVPEGWLPTESGKKWMAAEEARLG